VPPPQLLFNVTVSDIVDGYSEYTQLIETDLAYAGSIWASHINSSASIEVQVNIAEIPSNIANGAAATSLGLSSNDGINHWQLGTIHEMLTGQNPNGTASDVIIKVDPDYINLWLFFDPNPSPTSAVPANRCCRGVRTRAGPRPWVRWPPKSNHRRCWSEWSYDLRCLRNFRRKVPYLGAQSGGSRWAPFR
jgi:hypothetical protein